MTKGRGWMAGRGSLPPSATLSSTQWGSVQAGAAAGRGTAGRSASKATVSLPGRSLMSKETRSLLAAAEGEDDALPGTSSQPEDDGVRGHELQLPGHQPQAARDHASAPAIEPPRPSL